MKEVKKVNFRDWVVYMCKLYRKESNKFLLDYDFEKGVTRIFSRATGKMAIAKCRATEPYQYDVGLAIAFSRMKGMRIPTFYEEKTAREASPNVAYAPIEAPEETVWYKVGKAPDVMGNDSESYVFWNTDDEMFGVSDGDAQVCRYYTIFD